MQRGHTTFGQLEKAVVELLLAVLRWQSVCLELRRAGMVPDTTFVAIVQHLSSQTTQLSRGDWEIRLMSGAGHPVRYGR